MSEPYVPTTDEIDADLALSGFNAREQYPEFGGMALREAYRIGWDARAAHDAEVTEALRAEAGLQTRLAMSYADLREAAETEVEGLRAEVVRLRERMDATPPHVSGGMSASYWYEQTIKARAGRSAERAKARAADLHASAAEAEIERLQEVNRDAEAKIAAVEGLAEEWARDEADHLATFGQHHPASLSKVEAMLRAALTGGPRP